MFVLWIARLRVSHFLEVGGIYTICQVNGIRVLGSLWAALVKFGMRVLMWRGMYCTLIWG